MPELPEVTITSSQLNDEANGWTIVSIYVSRFFENKFQNFFEMEDQLPLKVENITNRAKYIIFQLENDWTLISHMILHGHWSIYESDKVCASIHLEKEDKTKTLYYYDKRGLGFLNFFTTEKAYEKLDELALSMFEDIKFPVFLKGVRRHPRSCIFALLHDQSKVISGVGNYIANESLYIAKIPPLRKSKEITDDELLDLFEAIKKVTEDSYYYGGVSTEDYLNVYDEKGKYQKYLRVYREKKDPNGYEVVKKKIGGKNAHWVNEIQV